jgi:hypothetical protein
VLFGVAWRPSRQRLPFRYGLTKMYLSGLRRRGLATKLASTQCYAHSVMHRSNSFFDTDARPDTSLSFEIMLDVLLIVASATCASRTLLLCAGQVGR